ncbi:F0F1 ATP synthase subunit B' [Paracoccus sp. (in: a-proteobacteria)]|uniref:F0F1 ATP synthase subunit B' n=1 Tax=Paracoccus sp. TaxID=267 RepID=UPI0026DF4C2A|nr:F0F1 ATP synthase subunit B' [Paracoccus sp. (in: a-proteobacteria)]MDO5646855.1 F0F1 ATP synthase subunit B' [Paracoccus sp. (in: a-proteobacteria)]
MSSLLQATAPTAVETTPQGVITVDQTAPAHGAGHAASYGVEPAAVADHAAQASGLPQLDVTTFANQIFWLVITLVVLYLVLSRVALPRIGAVISDRQGAITGDLMAAEEFKLKAREAEAAYDKALADARAEAQQIVGKNRAEIQAELDAAIAKADAEIAARAAESEKRIAEIRESAVANAHDVARDVTAELVRSFGGTVDQAAIDSAVDNRMKEVLQ